MRLSLLLRDDATTLADIYIARDDEDYLVLAEGLSGADLVDALRGGPGSRVEIADLGEDHAILSVHGPYAWELLSRVLGPDIAGLPYLTFFRAGDSICFRGGKTGEYGYDLLVPRAEIKEVEARLLSVGDDFDIAPVGLDALDRCALENWFFNIRKEGSMGLTPIELGLQWRVSYQKEYRGSASLMARRKETDGRRITCVLGQDSPSPSPSASQSPSLPWRAGDGVYFGEKPIGSLLYGQISPILRAPIGIALLDRPYAHSGVDRYQLLDGPSGARLPLRTASPPVIDNRSLYVSPQRHSYETRADDTFPPLV